MVILYESSKIDEKLGGPSETHRGPFKIFSGFFSVCVLTPARRYNQSQISVEL